MGVGRLGTGVLLTGLRANVTRGAATLNAASTANTTGAVSADGSVQQRVPVAVPFGGIAGATSSDWPAPAHQVSAKVAPEALNKWTR